MNNSEFKILVREIRTEILAEQKNIDKILRIELSKGNNISLQKAKKVLDDFEEHADTFIKENQSIAVAFEGNPEITITYILDSIMHNNKITISVSENKQLTELLVNIVLNSMNKRQIQNNWIRYNSNYNEIYLKDNEKFFDKIVYIGDIFEYEKFCSLFTKQVEYNNYGHIKLFIDKVKNNAEYQKIVSFARNENIFLETYDDIQEFIGESKNEDFAVAFITEFRDINKIQKELRAEEIMINSFPYDSYCFRVNR